MTKKKGGKVAKKEEERKKKLIMWIGISLVMVLILVGWIFNTKNVFNQSKNNSPNPDQFEWSRIKNELSQVINKTKENINQLKEDSIVQEARNELQTTDQKNKDEIFFKPLPLAEDNNEFSEEEILELKNKLE